MRWATAGWNRALPPFRVTRAGAADVGDDFVNLLGVEVCVEVVGRFSSTVVEGVVDGLGINIFPNACFFELGISRRRIGIRDEREFYFFCGASR